MDTEKRIQDLENVIELLQKRLDDLERYKRNYTQEEVIKKRIVFNGEVTFKKKVLDSSGVTVIN